MTVRKKLFSILLIAMMMVSLAGCGSEYNQTAMIVNDVEVPQGVINYYYNSMVDQFKMYGLDPESEDSAAILSMAEENAVQTATQMAVVKAAAKELGLEPDAADVQTQLDAFKASFDVFDNTETENEEQNTTESTAEVSHGNVAYAATNEEAAANETSEEQSTSDESAATEEPAQETTEEEYDITTYDGYLEYIGTNEECLKWILEAFVLQEQIFYELNKDVATDAELQAAYEEDPSAYDTIEVSHILIAVDDPENATQADWDEAKAKAEDVIKQLDEGADFATLAAEYNTDATAYTGGKLDGAFGKTNSSYVQEFVDGAFLLENVGDYSKTPVKTSYGYHIIKLDVKNTGWENLKEEIMTTLHGEEMYETFNTFMEEKLANPTIEKDYERQHAVEEETDNTTSNDGNTDDTNTDTKTDGAATNEESADAGQTDAATGDTPAADETQTNAADGAQNDGQEDAE